MLAKFRAFPVGDVVTKLERAEFFRQIVPNHPRHGYSIFPVGWMVSRHVDGDHEHPVADDGPRWRSSS